MGEYKNVPQEINNVVQDNLEKLAQLFPSAVKDGQLDVNALKEELGTFEEVGKEKYEFTWSGKQNAKKIAQQDVFGKTLKFCPEKSKNADTSENIYIEGDNLEALKLLRQNYYNSIKMIYIDPPYNTGNDFVYNDDFSMSQEESDIAEGVVDELGERYTKNVSGNKFHANWCNMIYPRLKLAKDLLTDDGVIFISIDDNEVENLKEILNEVFGEQNFEGHIHWRRRHNQPNDKTKMLGIVTEHILAYAKNSIYLKSVGVGKLDLTANFTNADNDPRGPWASKPWKVGSDQSGSRYTITTPTGKVLDGEWMGDKETYLKYLEEGRMYFPKGGDGMPRKKYYQFEREEEGQCATNWWSHEQFGHNQGANECMTALFEKKNIFSNPKPIELLRSLIKVGNVKKEELVLDFFSGSAALAHAVMQLNAEAGGHRKYIMVQLEEKTDEKSEAHKAGYNTICEIGEERIRRAGDKIKAEHPDADIDIGFKVFEIADTNIKWNELELKDEQVDFDSLSDNPDQIDFKEGTKDIDVVYEIMLRQKNIPLSSKVEVLDEIGSRTYLYADSYLVCLETQVTNEMIDKLASLDPTPFKYIFRDSAFKDDIDLKTNAFRRLKAMVEKHAGASKKAYTVEFI